jgi:hypothetical protein
MKNAVTLYAENNYLRSQVTKKDQRIHVLEELLLALRQKHFVRLQ